MVFILIKMVINKLILNTEQNKEKMVKQYDQYSGVFFFIKIKRLDISIYKHIFQIYLEDQNKNKNG